MVTHAKMLALVAVPLLAIAAAGCMPYGETYVYGPAYGPVYGPAYCPPPPVAVYPVVPRYPVVVPAPHAYYRPAPRVFVRPSPPPYRHSPRFEGRSWSPRSHR